MHRHFLSSSVTMAPPSSSSLSKPLQKPSNSNSPNYPSSSSPPYVITTPLQLPFVSSSSFLYSSQVHSSSYPTSHTSLIPFLSFSHTHHILLLLFLPFLTHLQQNVDVSTQCIFYTFFVLVFLIVVVFFEICCGFGFRSRKCGKPGCKGLRRTMEFDLQLQGEECLMRSGGCETKAMGEMNELPWKGGTENNPDYECLRAELRKMAPPNGRAVLLLRSRCGCPVAKLEGWGAKRGRRHKKTLALNGKADHR